MKKGSISLVIFSKANNLIDLNEYERAIDYIKDSVNFISDSQDKALAYTICGFINYKLNDYFAAIEDFSLAITYEEKFDFLDGRSMDISYSGRSNSRYKNGDFKEAIEDKRIARKIRLLEDQAISLINQSIIDYKGILLGRYCDKNLEPKYKLLARISKIKKSKYDLIDDYKKFIDNEKIEKVINKLEELSESRYEKGDFKASINAIRRAEKYY